VPQLTVHEASAAYIRAMRNVPAARDGLCEICSTFTPPEYSVCLSCSRQPNNLDVVVPITYSEHLGQMHHALRSYKDGVDEVQRYATPRLTAILWRFLDEHEDCVARAAGATVFDIVATVPSSSPEADEARMGLRTIVEWCEPISGRYERVLSATGAAPPGRMYHPGRYTADRVDGQQILLIDVTWTAGGHAQSAAYALRSAGAERIALVVIGRHLRADWEVTPGKTSGDLFAELPLVFDWTTCAVHA
jgi:predicted amidophosphoribosyltransferase